MVHSLQEANLQTSVSSILIIVSALVIRFTGFLAIDRLLAMAFGLVLLWASWSILREALHILLQGTPDDLDLESAIDAIRGLEGVTDVHHVQLGPVPALFWSSESDAQQEGDQIWQRHAATSSSGMRCASRSPAA
ncbi:hypothetical protein [Paracoccus endophyticus]|uniref:hypothetical protein n=1 Tax=Paracoccus endophyticus TaxID=2233774 RepID=UPI001F0B7C55|nr:hypothetical protein [Paracoccus endophyticus]